MAWPMPTDPLLQWVVPSALVFLFALLLAGMTLYRGPRGAQVVLLAAILATEGAITFVVGVIGPGPIERDSLAQAFAASVGAAFYLAPVLYLGLLSTLDSPWVGWLRRGRWIVLFLPAGYAAYDAIIREYSSAAWGLGFLILVHLYAIVVALSATRRAPRGSPERARAKAFAVAFIARDLLMLLFVALLTIGSPDITRWPAWKVFVFTATNPLAIIQLVYLPLLAYGILRTRLFDIDLRIKKGIRAATITSAFVVVFYVASEITQEFVGERVGPYVGIFAAGALLVGVRPLQHVANRVAEAAMPGVTGTEAYIAERKLLVYRSAVEAALEDGALGKKERVMLARIGGELGLDPRAMVAIEDEALAARAAA